MYAVSDARWTPALGCSVTGPSAVMSPPKVVSYSTDPPIETDSASNPFCAMLSTPSARSRLPNFELIVSVALVARASNLRLR